MYERVKVSHELYELMETLGAEEQEQLQEEIQLEERARQLRQREAGKYCFEALDNKAKLEVLSKWYPNAYQALQRFFPGFVEDPKEHRGIVSAVNSVIYPMCGQHRNDFVFT